MNHVLPQSFFDRPTSLVAEELLGKILCHEDDIKTELMITEVEAYDGPEDRASHAFRGKTPRNSVMFGPPGFWYVYFIYGIHWMLNIVTEKEDYPAAILIRGAGNFDGPGKLGKALNINNSYHAKPSAKSSGLWIEDQGIAIPCRKIQKTSRIGIDYAGSIWSKKPYRFLISKPIT